MGRPASVIANLAAKGVSSKLYSMDADEINVDHLARLAALRLREEERPGVLGDLRRIIALVDQMQAVDVEGVVPLAHPLDAAVRLRPDEVTEAVDREHYQRCAPATAQAGAGIAGHPAAQAAAGGEGHWVRDGLYIVPRAVE